MIKYFIIFLTGIIITTSANGMVKDTAIYYYKNLQNGNYKNCSADTCDFFRLILPPDSGKKLWDIKDYYRNGKVKLLANAAYETINWSNGNVYIFDQEFISYYENGNRHRILTFGKSKHEDFEYYPNGKMHCSIRYIFGDGLFLWDCFNNKGELICEKGNGRWVTYNDCCNKII